jgi:hypothetical protein
MKLVRLSLPESPSANRYGRHARGRTYLSAEAADYRRTVPEAYARAQHGRRDVPLNAARSVAHLVSRAPL